MDELIPNMPGQELADAGYTPQSGYSEQATFPNLDRWFSGIQSAIWDSTHPQTVTPQSHLLLYGVVAIAIVVVALSITKK